MKNLILLIILLSAFAASAQSKGDVFKKQNQSTLVIEKNVGIMISRDDVEAKLLEYDQAINNLKAEKQKYVSLKRKCDSLSIKLSKDTIVVIPKNQKK